MTPLQTIRERLFEVLPDHAALWLQRAIEESSDTHHYLDEPAAQWPYSLTGSFSWCNTPEGHGYWSSLLTQHFPRAPR